MTDLKEIFIKNDFEKLLELKSSGELFAAIPEFKECFSCPQNNKHHCYNVGEHIFESVRIAKQSCLRGFLRVKERMMYYLYKGKEIA